MLGSNVVALAGFGLLSTAQQLVSDPGVYGPPIELVHLYYDEFPTGTLALNFVLVENS